MTFRDVDVLGIYEIVERFIAEKLPRGCCLRPSLPQLDNLDN